MQRGTGAPQHFAQFASLRSYYCTHCAPKKCTTVYHFQTKQLDFSGTPSNSQTSKWHQAYAWIPSWRIFLATPMPKLEIRRRSACDRRWGWDDYTRSVCVITNAEACASFSSLKTNAVESKICNTNTQHCLSSRSSTFFSVIWPKVTKLQPFEAPSGEWIYQ